MKQEEWQRLRSCTNKQAYQTRFYAECVRDNVLREPDRPVYRCKFCKEFHIGDAQRSR